MKFLHTADWQIGMRAAHVGGVGQRVRDERIEAGRRAVRAARDHGADFLLLAGDTFEDNAIDRVLVQKVADLLAEFAGPVYVIPGNHDPLVPGSRLGTPGLAVARESARPGQGRAARNPRRRALPLPAV